MRRFWDLFCPTLNKKYGHGIAVSAFLFLLVDFLLILQKTLYFQFLLSVTLIIISFPPCPASPANPGRNRNHLERSPAYRHLGH